jgi:UDP-N-acetylglucosamine diphosphorylase / glucose-1-phosphate thymidylyltransferase / UDP-N-acetylgalactosamine diphosphorylase / glucosamine-1-phosphate N-acetyltransferase / galactosamine-1-phosphate N-acetyltransferase
VNKAIILAAGKGTRMGELTEQLPKPMLPLAGRPMIEHILDRLREAGFSQALIVTGFRAETIEQHLANYPMSVEFRRDNLIKGTGSAALVARDFTANDPALLTFGDIICEPADYKGIAERLERAPQAAGVLGVKHVDDPWQGAAIYEDQGVVHRVIEKPPKGSSTTHWNSAGLFTIQPVIFDYLARLKPSIRGEYELTAAFSDLIEAGEQVLLYAIQGGWRDVGRPDDLLAAEQLVD